MSHEYALRAHTPQDAQKWYETIRAAAGQVTNDPPTSSPSSPSESRQPSSTINPEASAVPTSTAGTAGTTGAANDQYAMGAAEKEAAYANQAAADKTY